MRIRLLGAHNLETRDTCHACFLVDGRLAIDAGSLVSALSLDELSNLEALLLTHQHFDHTRDLPTLGLIRKDAGRLLDTYALQSTFDRLWFRMIDDDLYPDPAKELGALPPRLALHPVEPRHSFRAASCQVLPLTVPHPVPAIGYIVTAADGAAAAFTGDLGAACSPSS